MTTDNTYSRWFGRLVWAGVVANTVLAVSTLVDPSWVLSMLGLPVADPEIWPRFACWLLLLLSAFYVTATRPLAAVNAARMTVLARFASVVFFGVNVLAGQSPLYLLFSLFDLTFGLPQALLLYLALRQERGTLERLPRLFHPWYVWSAIPLLLLFAAYTLWMLLFREQSVRYESDEEHFKYGSVGTDIDHGLPYWIWLVLPRVFPEKLPGEGGYASLGMVWEYGHEVPVGISKRSVGFPRVNVNCAACHTSSYRKSADEGAPTLVAGGTSQTFDVQGYLRFLFACASDVRFTPDILLPEIERVQALSFLESALYRYVLIPRTRSALLQQKKSYAWMDTRPAWGRGRTDSFNSVKFTLLQQPEDGSIGNSDMLPLWRMKDRPHGGYHWDGLNPVLREVVISSAIDDGAPPKRINRPDTQESLRRVEDFIAGLPAPPYPFPVDAALAKTGRDFYVRQCAQCHGGEGQQAGRLVPVAEVGTDAHRMEMWTEGSARAYNAYTQGHEWELKAFRKESGYVSMPLHGLWLRAPYLHNGSVPSLQELLEPVARRSTSFYRGNDVYDPDAVGFFSTQAQVKRNGVVFPLFLYDTTLPGNGNQGHLYGTGLASDAKRALLEYLKTL